MWEYLFIFGGILLITIVLTMGFIIGLLVYFDRRSKERFPRCTSERGRK